LSGFALCSRLSGRDCISADLTGPLARHRKAASTHADGQQPHIVCVNHSPEILELQQELLEEAGFRVTTWSRLDRDLDRIVELAPDVIIVDYM
jgi:response regulator RpfG family c-di-GMP phosphodiesterase